MQTCKILPVVSSDSSNNFIDTTMPSRHDINYAFAFVRCLQIGPQRGKELISVDPIQSLSHGDENCRSMNYFLACRIDATFYCDQKKGYRVYTVYSIEENMIS